MPGYTVAALVAVLVVVVLERLWWRTGIFSTARYWWSMAIIAFFMVLVDGWLTRGPLPVVAYDREAIIGLRVPGSIPVEDYGFGFALVTWTIVRWQLRAVRGPDPTGPVRLHGRRLLRRVSRPPRPGAPPGARTVTPTDIAAGDGDDSVRPSPQAPTWFARSSRTPHTTRWPSVLRKAVRRGAADAVRP
ncbi:MAG: lycopene cyclase domain-containing protein [Nocardioidaceae bacterium]|nr:lycopene cyclase domain-containing protein [Nocardioidaceae bacterium]